MTGKQVFNTSRNLVAAHKLFSLAILGVAVLLAYQFGSGVVSGVREHFADKQITKIEAQGAQAVSEAAGALHQADAASVDRQVEDRVRAATIEPERERAAQQIKVIRERSRLAQVNYELSKDPARVVATDDAALFARNCADYARLYPGRSRRSCR
jgi:hypothetical protein